MCYLFAFLEHQPVVPPAVGDVLYILCYFSLCKLWRTHGPLKVVIWSLAPIPLVSPRALSTMPLYSITP